MPHTIDIIPYNTHYVYLAAIVCGQKIPLRKANILRALLASILMRDVRGIEKMLHVGSEPQTSTNKQLSGTGRVMDDGGRRQLMHSEYVEVFRMYGS